MAVENGEGLYQKPVQGKLFDQIPPSKFLRKLEAQWNAGKFLCVGLDPVLEKIPAEFKKGTDGDSLSTEETLFRFTKTMVDATHDIACAFKPNLAFYEQYDEEGRRALRRLIEYIAATYPQIVIILDSKRGDIGATNDRYAIHDLDSLPTDAVTLQSYFGGKSLEPFLKRTDKGHIILARTSNPGAEEIQSVPLRGRDRNLAYRVARLAAKEWNTCGTIGLVVGATYPEDMAAIRAIVGDMPVVAPGIGTQGGDLERTVRAAKDSRGKGFTLNVGSALSEVKQLMAESFFDAVRRRASQYRAEIGSALQLPRLSAHEIDREKHPEGFTPAQESLLTEMMRIGAVKFGDFKLKVHKQHPDCPLSPVYFNLRELIRFPGAKQLAARVYEDMLVQHDFDLLAGVPTAATPIASTVADNFEVGLVTPRADKKAYGSGATVDGWQDVDGEEERSVALIEDVATTGSSIREAAETLRAVRAQIRDVFVLVDREQGAKENLAKIGLELHAAFTLDRMLAFYVRAGQMTAEQVSAIKMRLGEIDAYLASQQR